MYIFRLMTMYLYIEIYSGLWPINRRAIYFVAIEEEYQNFFNQNSVFSMRLINIAPLNYLLQYTLHLELKLCYKTVHLNHTSKVYIILYPIMYIPDSGLFDIHYMPPHSSETTMWWPAFIFLLAHFSFYSVISATGR